MPPKQGIALYSKGKSNIKYHVYYVFKRTYFEGLRNQFAYSKNFSITAPLLKLADEWKWAVDNDPIMVAMFLLDLPKAFDVTNHSLLLHKLRFNGISGVEHAWFESYFTGRK